jgi:flavodoxin
MSRLVAYFSYSGVTKRAAEKIAAQEGAELFEIQAEKPYTKDDVNWQNNLSRNVKEFREPSSRPGIVAMPDLSGVDELWVGYPIWWYTQPRIINTFFDQADLSGKKVHLFATSGGTGIDGSLNELKETYPEVEFVDAKRVR